jgi:hypothetical protein
MQEHTKILTGLALGAVVLGDQSGSALSSFPNVGPLSCMLMK